MSVKNVAKIVFSVMGIVAMQYNNYTACSALQVRRCTKMGEDDPKYDTHVPSGHGANLRYIQVQRNAVNKKLGLPLYQKSRKTRMTKTIYRVFGRGGPSSCGACGRDIMKGGRTDLENYPYTDGSRHKICEFCAEALKKWKRENLLKKARDARSDLEKWNRESVELREALGKSVKALQQKRKENEERQKKEIKRRRDIERREIRRSKEREIRKINVKPMSY